MESASESGDVAGQRNMSFSGTMCIRVGSSGRNVRQRAGDPVNNAALKVSMELGSSSGVFEYFSKFWKLRIHDKGVAASVAGAHANDVNVERCKTIHDAPSDFQRATHSSRPLF